MGFFSKSEKEYEPPSRNKREQCWESRDLYFACLDKNNIENPLDPAKAKLSDKFCGAEDKQFQKDCVASWVKYFKEKRPFDLKKERMLKEAAENGQEVIQMEGYRK
jgi:cytochrome c oxidase assembly factor 6